MLLKKIKVKKHKILSILYKSYKVLLKYFLFINSLKNFVLFFKFFMVKEYIHLPKILKRILKLILFNDKFYFFLLNIKFNVKKLVVFLVKILNKYYGRKKIILKIFLNNLYKKYFINKNVFSYYEI